MRPTYTELVIGMVIGVLVSLILLGHWGCS